MDIAKIKRLDNLIRHKATGCPEALAEKFAVSKRMVFNYLRYIKKEMKAPVGWCRKHRSYIYTEAGKLPMEWVK